MNRLCAGFCTLLFVLILQSPIALAFGIPTHRVLNERAAAVSTLDAILKTELGLVDGLSQSVGNQTGSRWIWFGGQAEDEFHGIETLGAFFRSRHHFHDPLQPWSLAGLSGLSACLPLPISSQASIRWAQATDQGFSGPAAWGDGRRRFLDSLTLASKERRYGALAETLQILGQQMHLVADLGVPAHVRNDPHCPMPEGFEDWARTNTTIIDNILGGEVVRPDRAIFDIGQPIADDIAVVPIARLWDTDQYNGTNPDVTVGNSAIGLAEYTNANFFSDDTVFAKYPFPAARSMDLGAPEVEPKTGELRRYFRKITDGEPLDHLAVPSALFDELPEALKSRRIGLDDTVFREYAGKLLPRAVGYSAALLDYFFRGRLDLDLVNDPIDPDVVRLEGANASPENLDGGTLTLYADDAKGTRRPAATIESGAGALLVTAEAGAPIRSMQFRAPADAERFVAVYRGTLGHEVERPSDDPALTFPGAVIGKVLGGVRVEQIFLDWPECDVPRVPGSADLLFETTDEGPVVRVARRQDVAFPFGLSLGTTVNLVHTVEYRQHLFTQEETSVFVWAPVADDIENNDSENYTFSKYERTDLKVETPVNESASFNDSLAITLDPARYQEGDFFRPNFAWSLQDFSFTRDGRVLAVVNANLTAPPTFNARRVEFPVYEIDAGEVQKTQICTPACRDMTVSFFQPVPEAGPPLVWALVDVTNRALVASTAGATITIASQQIAETPDWSSGGSLLGRIVYLTTRERRDGGPRPRTFEHGQTAARTRGTRIETVDVDQTYEVSFATGDGTTISNRLRPELAGIGGSGAAVTPLPLPVEYFYGGQGSAQLRLVATQTLSLPQQFGIRIYQL
ncbi:MAG: hypothetical protein HY216_13520, partial [Candidatus Rokubacteria bacterium]|nr:hypothetical protein [Candidatus Rokubacteria bacterium]